MSLQFMGLTTLPFSQSVYTKENLQRASLSFKKLPFTNTRLPRSMLLAGNMRKCSFRASKVEIVDCDDDKKKESSKSTKSDPTVVIDDDDDDDFEMDEEERKEFRKKIRQVIEMNPEVKDIDPEEKKKMMEKLLSDYPLVVDEQDPDWPEDAEGRGFNFSQFFDKMSIKNVKKDDDDEGYDSENEVNWQDIRAIKDITSQEWEDTVFQDLSPLIVLVHNRYRRPKENEMARDMLEKAIQIIWDCRIPSPRCVAIDAVVECDLVSTLGVSVFPELIFTKVGKILHREKEIRTADELSKMMAFFYYGAAKPPCLGDTFVMSDDDIPGFTTKK